MYQQIFQKDFFWVKLINVEVNKTFHRAIFTLLIVFQLKLGNYKTLTFKIGV